MDANGSKSWALSTDMPELGVKLKLSLSHLCGVCPCLLYWGAQNWAQRSRCGFTGAERAGQR